MAEVDEFQVRLYTADGIRDEIEVLVELAERQAEASWRSWAGELAEAHEGLRFGVREAEAGILPRFELKAKRLTDEREVWGGKGERKAM